MSPQEIIIIICRRLFNIKNLVVLEKASKTTTKYTRWQ